MNRDDRLSAISGGRWLILAVLFLARTAMGLQFQAVAALSPYVIADLAIDYARLGWLIGLYLLPGIAIAYPGGMLGQHFGDKRIAILGMALMLAGGLATAVPASFAIVAAGRIVGGAGAVLLNVVLTKMTTDWFIDREIGTALAILVSSWPIGIGIALALLPWLAVHASIAAAFASTAGAAAAVLILIALIYRAPPATAPPGATTRPRLSPAEIGLASLAGGVWTLFNVGYILVVSFGPALLASRGLSAQDAGLVTSLASWAMIVTIPLGGVLIDRVGHASALMIASFILLGVAIALVPATPSLALMTFVGAVAGLPCGAMMVLPGEVLHPQNRSAGMGVFYTWYYIGMALLVPAAGKLRDATSLPGAPLWFAGALVIGAMALLVLFRAVQRRAFRRLT
ncbi:MAG TPA: MFS transporter [Xanthobacteraceae bacterium]|nr:MFS transporter [Xanthobacteraceae bacterium]